MREQREKSAKQKRVFLKANIVTQQSALTETHMFSPGHVWK